jgi:GntR family transcriptional regulator
VIFRLNQSSGIPLYVQLIEQVKHAVETGALREGDQLPTIRKVAVDLVMNPNTVVRAYRELEHEGVIELKHGSGAFIKESAGGRARIMRKAQAIVQSALERLASLSLTEDELRRVFENELAQSRVGKSIESGENRLGNEDKRSENGEGKL